MKILIFQSSFWIDKILILIILNFPYIFYILHVCLFKTIIQCVFILLMYFPCEYMCLFGPKSSQFQGEWEKFENLPDRLH